MPWPWPCPVPPGGCHPGTVPPARLPCDWTRNAADSGAAAGASTRGLCGRPWPGARGRLGGGATCEECGGTGKAINLHHFRKVFWTVYTPLLRDAQGASGALAAFYERARKDPAALGPVVKACASKMNENVAKEMFNKGCAKDPKLEKFCACAWKELRKAAGSAAEIQAGLLDDAKMRSALDKGCSKLRPK